MSSPPAPPISDASGIRYPSLAALQTAHNDLLRRQREQSEEAMFRAEVNDFLRQATATGALLDSDDDRQTAQSMLDYWVARLYRVGEEPPDATLADFDVLLAPELPDDLCPYVGLDAFRENDSSKFFGRERLVAELVAKLPHHRLLAIVGPSGSGKSSLVRAGLIPALKGDVLPDSKNWNYLPTIVPGSDPLASLNRVVRTKNQELGTESAPSDLSSRLLDSPLVLVVDQFEELFTLCDDERARQTFIAKLLQLVEAPTSQHRLILTMRSDFEAFVARAPRLQALFEAGRVQVTPLSAAELREAIEQPAEPIGLKFEAGVVDLLLQDILGEPAGLPLLQFTLLKLWESRERNRVTRVAYEKVGGGRLALARSADAFYSSLIPEEQVTARRILLRMVRPGEGLEITSSRIRRDDLYRGGEDPGRVDRVLAKLITAHLVRLTESETPDAQVEVAHEALVRNWPTLVEWLEEEKTALAVRRRLEGRAAEWVRLGQGSGGLLDEIELREAERWLASVEGDRLGYTSELSALVIASKAAVEEAGREKEAARQRELEFARVRARRRSQLATILLVLLALALAATGYAITQQIRARDQRNLAQTAHTQAQNEAALSRTAEANAVEQGNLAQTAKAEAVDQSHLAQTAEAEAQTVAQREISTNQLQARAGEALLELSRGNVDLALLITRASVPTDTQMYPPLISYVMHHAFEATVRSSLLIGHGDWVVAVAWSPNGHQVVTGSDDGTARIWDPLTRKVVETLVGHAAQVRAVAWSPDGKRILTGSADNTARIWDVVTATPVLTLTGTAEVRAVAWSPDGRQVLTGGADRIARIWDANSGQLKHQMPIPNGQILAVAWSPNARQVLTGGADQIARIWDADTGQPRRALTGHTNWILAVAWSPDGRYVLTGSGDQSARIWESATGKLVRTLTGHTGDVGAVAWGHDGKLILTGSKDGTARVWDAETGKLVQSLAGHADGVWAVAWSPDGHQVLTGSADHTARLWDFVIGAPVRMLIGHTEDVKAVAWSPDGHYVLTGSRDKTARIWNSATGTAVLTLTAHSKEVWAVAWSPDGRSVLTGSADQTARIWDVASGQPLRILSGHTGDIWAVAWSPDGRYVLTGGKDGTARIWDAATGQPLQMLSGHTEDIWAVAWSPDGRYVLTGGKDGTARIWDAILGQQRQKLEYPGEVWAIAWSPDGRQVLTGGTDQTVRLWDVVSGQLMRTLTGHTGVIWRASWSRDGQYILTSSTDKTARLWNSMAGTVAQILEGHTGEVWAADWSPDGYQVLTGSQDGTARLWIVESRLIVAELTHRICNLFSNDDIRKQIPTWHGCSNELAAVATDLKAFDELRDGK